MKSLIAVLLALSLGACATAAQRERTRMEGAVDQGGKEIDACTARVAVSAPYQALKEKLPDPVTWSPASLAQQANTAKPTPREIEYLFALHQDGIVPCRKAVLETTGRVHPSLVTALAESYVRTDAMYLRLVKGEISWGDFAQFRNQDRQNTTTKLSVVAAQIEGRLDQSNAAELAQRRAATAALQQWIYQQQLLNQQQQVLQRMSQPRMTNCSYVGGYLSCTTY